MLTRVLIDGRALGDDSAFRGIGRYVYDVLASLRDVPYIDVAVLATRDARVPDGIEHVPMTRRAPGRFRGREHELLLPRDLRKWPADVVHSPALDPPRRSPAPWVQTLHDVFPLTMDMALHRRERERLRRLRERYQRADAVIAISGFVAEQAVSVLDLEPADVHVIHHGVDDRFVPPPDGNHDRHEPYLLMVAEYDPRKAHDVAFDVVGRLAGRGLGLPLKVAGRIAPWYAERLAALVAAAPRPDLIETLGYVSDEDLVRLYQRATALLVTSAGEGFGFPAVEAMACGTPVVAFDNSATREVVADGGLLVTDGHVDDLVDELARVVAHDELRHQLSARGLARAAQFSWAESARRHAELFASLR